MPNVRLPQSSATLPAASKQFVYFFGDGKAEGKGGMKESSAARVPAWPR